MRIATVYADVSYPTPSAHMYVNVLHGESWEYMLVRAPVGQDGGEVWGSIATFGLILGVSGEVWGFVITLELSGATWIQRGGCKRVCWHFEKEKVL